MYAARARRLAAGLAAGFALSGCVSPAPAAPAVLRASPPPWPAPRDGISYFTLADVPTSRLDDRTDQRVVSIDIRIDGVAVPLVPSIGVDRPRALQAPAHTHDDSGAVWLEGAGARAVTLGQFFTIWGVRFDRRCLGAACGGVRVTSGGTAVADPVALPLWGAADVQIRVGRES